MNKNIFKTNTFSSKHNPATDTVNEAGGRAYSRTAEAELAQLCVTGCFNDTFYTKGEDQLDRILKLSTQVSAKYLAKLAVYAREAGYMKDMPAALVAILSNHSDSDAKDYFARVFPIVINNGKMLRNFVQIIRSGKVGRESLGTLPKRMIQQFLEKDSDYLFRNSIGNDPKFSDVIKLAHPRPITKEHNALFGYLLDKKYNKRYLPKLVKEFEAYKNGDSDEIPDVPFQMIASLDLSDENWKRLAENATWQTLRMNLNTFARHGVFEDKKLLKKLVSKLSDRDEILSSKVFPYQLLNAYINTEGKVPAQLRNALQDAMEIAIENIPEIEGQIYVCPDVSGSMDSPVTGDRYGSTTTVTCRDIAALVSAAFLRKNSSTEVIPFSDRINKVSLNSRDSVMTNSEILRKLPSGGTDCSLPLHELNRRNACGDLVVYVSDNESWMDRGYYGATGLTEEWRKFKKRNPKAKLVCIDITPSSSTQAKDRKDCLNVGGFSDAVFDIISEFVRNGLDKDNFVSIINSVGIE